ncbi:hypothetical protein OG884_01495 [Streptosporangium sp. NBC_01755]|uniref:hypothetical protein n=1 Tax=unclassified Streptosporangium TaxID=2632669 RepID=UPI002DD99AEC|nr:MULTISPECIES: hypothetical protein [unclassified Streptosporangium]WSA27883.1 hypothetical protein OIE13_08465 [Streptosporangium sp. NBC_01810]WSD00645.1 hypothetical protein OG884_01495 [Streptosporangium sp. NBC_01755]
MNAAVRSVATVFGVLSLTVTLTTAVAVVAGEKVGGPAATTVLILAGGAGWQ